MKVIRINSLMIIISSMLGFMLVQDSTFAAPPAKINYQAIARNNAGNPLLNQNIQVRFTIRDGSTAGAIVYQETQFLTTNQFGLFTALIGGGTVVSPTPFSAISWSGNDKYLQVELDPSGGSTFIDMGTAQLVSVPYALFAKESSTSADNVWTPVGANIYNDNSGNVGIGTTTPANKLSIEDSVTANSTGIVQIRNTATGTNDAYGIVSESVPSDYYGIGGFFRGGYRGVMGVVNPTGNNVYYGVHGEVAGGTGFNTGVSGTANTQGVFGFGSGAGKGLTQYFGTSFPETAGLNGQATNFTSSNGRAYGIIGESFSPAGHVNCGLFGYAAGASAGANPANYGVLGITDGANGIGMLGISDNTGNARALEGRVLQGVTQTAIYTTIALDTAGNYAGYFDGPIYATNASAGIKSFKIDHPLDPDDKFLYHSSVESPDMMNIYNGNIVTDTDGNARIQLPDYFQALNKDFRYQLTCIGTFAQAIVSRKIENNVFYIKTNKPQVEVSWMVTGIRHDPVAEKYRIKPEVEKTQNEKGKYLIPGAYGKPASAAIQLPSPVNKGKGANQIFTPDLGNKK